MLWLASCSVEEYEQLACISAVSIVTQLLLTLTDLVVSFQISTAQEDTATACRTARCSGLPREAAMKQLT